jgi:hypothetical protein
VSAHSGAGRIRDQQRQPRDSAQTDGPSGSPERSASGRLVERSALPAQTPGMCAEDFFSLTVDSMCAGV